jgi:hypothetical protein
MMLQELRFLPAYLKKGAGFVSGKIEYIQAWRILQLTSRRIMACAAAMQFMLQSLCDSK